MVKPLKPSDVSTVKEECTPDFVIQAWNQTIAKNYNNGTSNFTLDELVHAILAQSPNEIVRSDVFKNNWCDLEEMYRKAGWHIVFDKPCYNESYKANFTFTRK